MILYHLTEAKAWEMALDKGFYAHPSLESEGFIHFSTEAQLLQTAARYFKSEDELVVLEVSEKKVKDLLKWEPSTNDELFPHVYGRLELSMVGNTNMLMRNKDGMWEKV